jgi:sugar phosphate isomerase/epimerase
VIYQDPEESGRDAVLRLSKALHRIAGAAASIGARLAVENMHTLRGPTLRSINEIIPVLRQADPSAGICLDVGHAIFNGFTGPRLGGEVRLARGNLISTHVHDSDRVGADPHLVPGDGIADWQALIRALTDIGYRGPFVLEVDGGADPVERLTRARTRFQQFLWHYQFASNQ